MALSALFLVIFAVADSPAGSWVAWEPRDSALVREVSEELASRPESNRVPLDFKLAVDPLSVVPDERFRSVFPQLKPSDSRIAHCQMGSTAGNSLTIEFTPTEVSDTTVGRKLLYCDHDSKRRASFCNLNLETGYRLPHSNQVFGLGKGLNPSTALSLMALLARGSYRIESPHPLPPHWPKEWWTHQAGQHLSIAPGSNRFDLSSPGCGCWKHLILEYGSARTKSEVFIVDLNEICV